jgi:thiol:disulfide interchange protein
MRLISATAVCLIVACLSALRAAPNLRLSPPPQAHTYAPVHSFDPKRDAAADIQAAIAEAQKTGKRIIVDVGGDWCSYCRQMDEFFQLHSDLAQLRDANFITVAVFYSSENKNEKVLSRYPKVEGIPHFFVLENDGTLLRSQHVLELRVSGAYDHDKTKDFLIKWAPRTDGVPSGLPKNSSPTSVKKASH